jgi:hypothetical protein
MSSTSIFMSICRPSDWQACRAGEVGNSRQINQVSRPSEFEIRISRFGFRLFEARTQGVAVRGWLIMSFS